VGYENLKARRDMAAKRQMKIRISGVFVGLAALALSAALAFPVEAARGGGNRGGSHAGHSGGHGHHHGHYRARTSVGVYFGPAWYPYYYYPPYPAYYYPSYYYPPNYYPYYYPPVASAPTTYIEKGASDSGGGSGNSLQSGYWYYCGSSSAYYPYVKECPDGWQQVAPTPAQ
jgi:hypothetical protein